jgi:hypothetical protein
LQQDVGVEAECSHEVNDVDRRFHELHEVRTDLKPKPSL